MLDDSFDLRGLGARDMPRLRAIVSSFGWSKHVRLKMMMSSLYELIPFSARLGAPSKLSLPNLSAGPPRRLAHPPRGLSGSKLYSVQVDLAWC